MKHLIQPIYMDDPWSFDENGPVYGYYCVNHGNTTPKWRTASVLSKDEYGTLTALAGAENDDKWVKAYTDQWVVATVKFATSCIKKATLRFYLPEITQVDARNGTPFYGIFFEFFLYINDVEITPPNGYDLAGPFAGISNFDEREPYIEYPLDISTPAQTVNYVVDLEALGIECRPCGTTWLIGFNYYAGDTNVTGVKGNMTLEIVDVTY